MDIHKCFVGKISSFLMAFVIVGLGYTAYYFFNQKNIGNQPVACTMEALQCPDGSYVGRSGSRCEFAACPPIGGVAVGQSVTIDGIKITLDGVTNDSRCPKGAQCVWAGNITAHVTLQSNIEKETIDMFSDKAISFSSHQISITDVFPPRTVNSSSLLDNYKITFKVDSR